MNHTLYNAIPGELYADRRSQRLEPRFGLGAWSGATQLTPASHLYFTAEPSAFGGRTAVPQNLLC